MTTGTWDPTAGAKTANTNVDIDILKQFIHYSENEQLEQLADIIEPQIQMEQRPLMSLAAEEWQTLGETFSEDQLRHLIRFFTRAEMLLASWDAGSKSPVIALVKILKNKGAALDKDFILWIKHNTTNRYLPHGPL